jgi:bifunctional aspartokinase / homoserine dehydrogenase 1
MKPTLLVASTACWFPTARLAIALANAGFNVEVVCPSRHPIRKTKAVGRIHRYRCLTPLSSFADAIVAAQPDFIVPSDDLATQHLHQLYHRKGHDRKTGGLIGRVIERSLGAPEGFRIVYARTRFMEMAQREGIRVPQTEVIHNVGGLWDWISRTGLPTVLKADGTSGGDGVKIVYTLEEAERAFRALEAPPLLARATKWAVVDQDSRLLWRSLLRRRSVVNAQAFVRGREATSTVVCWKGTVLASLHFEVLRKGNAVGPATVVRLINDPEMTTATGKMVRALNLSGVHGFDFMREAQTNTVHLIEVNPRATQVGHLRLGPGRDLAASLFAAVSGELVNIAPKTTESDTIALFPQELTRDPASPFLRVGHHDVPWEEPELVLAAAHRLRRRIPWYSRPGFRVFFAGSARLATTPLSQGKALPHTGVDSDTCTGPARDAAEVLHGGPVVVTATRPATATPLGSNTPIPECLSEHSLPHLSVRARSCKNVSKPLRIMKFGGTSVGDACSIEKAIEIVRSASRESALVVVVSAMSGVTNKLIEAGTKAQAGDRDSVETILAGLWRQHESAASTLIRRAPERERVIRRMRESFDETDRLCRGTLLLRELTLRARDSMSSLGERLLAPLMAAALGERGVASEAIEATELVVTNSHHGAAEPCMSSTRESCESRVLPLLRQETVPVVTGFIGATTKGVLTTLGRGGSDYSATILGAALGASEVIIWKDVDGLLTADPRLVPGARTIFEISYREAAELAHFGAPVLHPKTLDPVKHCGIPLWIRNTFAPERPGTKITPTATASGGMVRALAALNDIDVITIHGSGRAEAPDLLGRTLAATEAVGVNVLLAAQSLSEDVIRCAVDPPCARSAFEALSREFTAELVDKRLEAITLDSELAAVTVIGEHVRSAKGIVDRTLGALGRENVKTIAIVPSSLGGNVSISFLVAQKDMRTALATTHREFQLGEVGPVGAPLRQPLQSSTSMMNPGYIAP